MTMLKASEMPSCQSEEERKDEELRSAIGENEKARQDHLAVQRETVELCEELKIKKS